MWDVRKKEILAETKHSLSLEESGNICFSSSGLYIFVFDDYRLLNVWYSTTLSEARTQNPRYTKNRKCTQFISPPFKNGNKVCSNSFGWKSRMCVMTLSGGVALVIHDYINQQVVDMFHLRCLPTYGSDAYTSNLGGNNFLTWLDGQFVFVLSLENSSESIPFPL